MVCSFFESIEFHDIRVIACFEDFDLIFQEFIEFTFDCFSFDGFDRHLELGLLVKALIYITELTRPNFVLKDVVIDYFRHPSLNEDI
jgi:hypothetical protein